MSITPQATTSESPSVSLPDLLGKFSLLPQADLILRSSDSHEFHVQKLYVVDSSPVLEEQIAAAASCRTGPEGKSHPTGLLCLKEIKTNNSYH